MDQNSGPARARDWTGLREPRSTLPAITHVDGSARVQTVVARDQPDALSSCWRNSSAPPGAACSINTSFNVRGEPIVRSADDAYRCFVHTEMDYLFLGNYVLDRLAQPKGIPRGRSSGPQIDKMDCRLLIANGLPKSGKLFLQPGRPFREMSSRLKSACAYAATGRCRSPRPGNAFGAAGLRRHASPPDET